MNSDDVVASARQALAAYELTKELPFIPEQEGFRYDVWRACFEDHLEVWEYIALTEERQAASWASDNLKECLAAATTDEGRKASYSISAMLAHTHIAIYSENGLSGGNFRDEAHREQWQALFRKLQPQVFRIWLDALGSEAFVEALKDKSQRFGDVDFDALQASRGVV